MELTNEQTMRQIRPTNINDPMLVKSFLVVYPRRLIPPKKVEVMKKQLAILDPVYIKHNGDKNAPINAAYTQNKALAVSKGILFILNDKYITIPNVANIKKIENPPVMISRISGDDTQTIATAPVMHSAINMRVKTERIYFCSPISNEPIGPLLTLVFSIIKTHRKRTY
jgi:hypothetical protein